MEEGLNYCNQMKLFESFNVRVFKAAKSVILDLLFQNITFLIFKMTVLSNIAKTRVYILPAL